MKIGILQTGRSPDEMRETHGDYDDLFKNLLADRGFTFDTYPVLDGIFPANENAADGWLITGSKFGAYEDHDWIPPLEEFLRKAYAASVPIVGVCFGHQILAQALGGKVEKFAGGWSVGPTEYFSGTHENTDTVMAWHQDQVTELPEGAEVVAGNDFCQYAILSYGDRAFTIQPHPEFNAAFVKDLIAARRQVLPADIARDACTRINKPLTSLTFADRFETFFRKRVVT